MDSTFFIVGATHASDGQSTDTAKITKFRQIGVTKGPDLVLNDPRCIAQVLNAQPSPRVVGIEGPVF